MDEILAWWTLWTDFYIKHEDWEQALRMKWHRVADIQGRAT
jgi:hypothetical protein